MTRNKKKENQKSRERMMISLLNEKNFEQYIKDDILEINHFIAEVQKQPPEVFYRKKLL